MADSVGFIGLGTMGGPMAANLAKAGVPLVVYDANPAAAAAAARQVGVTVAGSPGDVASRVNVLFTCLPNDAIVRGVYLSPGGIAARGRQGLVRCAAGDLQGEHEQVGECGTHGGSLGCGRIAGLSAAIAGGARPAARRMRMGTVFPNSQTRNGLQI